MSCKVRLYFYDSNTEKSIFDEGCHLKINGDNAEGVTEQSDATLEFTYDSSALPGGGGYEFDKWAFSKSGVSFTPTSEASFSQDVTGIGYLEVRCCLKPITNPSFKILYKLNNGQADQEQDVKFNDPNTKLIDAPSKSKCVFVGWKVQEPASDIEGSVSEYAKDTAYNKGVVFWKNDINGVKTYYKATEDVLATEDPSRPDTPVNDGWDAMEQYSFRLGVDAGVYVYYAALSNFTPRNYSSPFSNILKMNAEWKSMTEDTETLYPAGEIIYYEDEQETIEIGRDSTDGGTSVKTKGSSDFTGMAVDSWKTTDGKTVKAGSTVKTNNGGGGSTGWSMRFHVSMAVNQTYWVRYDAKGGAVQPEPERVKAGTTITIAALPKKKNIRGEMDTALCWMSGGSSYAPPDTYVVNSDVTFTAEYKKAEKVTVYFSATGGGDVQTVINPKSAEYEVGKAYGSFFDVKDTAGNILEIEKVSGQDKYTTGKDNKLIKTSDEVKNPNTHTITAHLVPMKPITLSPNGSGAKIWVNDIPYSSPHKIRVSVTKDPTGKIIGIGALPAVNAKRDGGYNGYDKEVKDYKTEWYTSSAMSATKTFDTTAKENLNLNSAMVYVRWAQLVDFQVNGGKSFTKRDEDHGYFAGETYGHLPDKKIIKRDDYTFQGWFTAANGGEQIREGSIVTNSTKRTLYAHWLRSSQTVYFDPGEGICDWAKSETPGEQAESSYEIGQTYNKLPTATRTTGSQGEVYEFEGWHDHSAGAQPKVSVGDTVTDSEMRTLTAHYTLKSNTMVQFHTGDKGYFSGGGYDGMDWHETVYFKRGGTYRNGALDAEGKVIEQYTFPQPTGLDVWKFKKWRDGDGNTVVETDPVAEKAGLELFAFYEDTRVECTVSYDPNGGTIYTADKIVFSGNKAGALPLPTKDEYSFTGWRKQSAALAASRRDGEVSGELVTSTTIIEGDISVKASWSKKIFLYYAIAPQGNS